MPSRWSSLISTPGVRVQLRLLRPFARTTKSRGRPMIPTALLLAAMTILAAAPPPAGPSIPEPDRIRIAEAFRLARSLGDEIWPGWRDAPFAVLLVAGDQEFLVGHPRPPADFS